ncbi:hypothetical protein EBT16_07175 [bacterium]|nr:hypothetical protein [bacterium]
MIKEFLDWLRTASPEKKTKALALLGAGGVILVVAAISIVAILKAQNPGSALTHNTPENHEALAEGVHEKEGANGFPYEINQVSMAIMNRKGTKTAYAQFSLVLECPSEEVKKTMALNRAKLLDAIFVVGGNFYLDEFQGENASKTFDKFKADLLAQYKTDFKTASPSHISIKDWVIH